MISLLSPSIVLILLLLTIILLISLVNSTSVEVVVNGVLVIVWVVDDIVIGLVVSNIYSYPFIIAEAPSPNVIVLSVVSVVLIVPISLQVRDPLSNDRVP